MTQVVNSTWLAEPVIQQLQERVRGALIGFDDPGYDEVRRLYNGMIDKSPGLIVQCADVADVIACVNFAREHEVLLAIRGGGHNGPGLGSCNDGLVIDLSRLKGIRVDPMNRTVRVEAGCRWGEVDHATQPFGLAVPAGIVANTGVAGLTLGGGHGYLARKYGLTIDSLISVDVVLADGSFVTASEDENADLFWALRGGGGNFGVVTSFLFRAHPLQTVYGGPMFWDIKDARAVMEWYRDFLPNAPRELSFFFGLKTVPSSPPFPEEIHGRRICALIGCWAGDLDQAEEAMRPFQELPEPIFAHVGPMPYPVLQSL